MTKPFTIDRYYFSPEWKALRRTVRARDGYRCQYCGRRGEQVDHIVPRKRGGPDVATNLVCCCVRCNKRAGNRLFPSFAEKQSWLRSHTQTTRTRRNTP